MKRRLVAPGSERRHPATLEVALSALHSAQAVFYDLDRTDWPASPSDEFHGRSGSCPVEYANAQKEVECAIVDLETEMTKVPSENTIDALR